jgi:Sel1 repeat
MPVDYFVVLIPVAFLAAVLVGCGTRRFRKVAFSLAAVLLALFVGIYFVPGWVLEFKARRGDAAAQYDLGVYYWTRLGFIGSDIEARDYWWLQAAKQGNRDAMYEVGYFSMYGTSTYIPRDFGAARKWLEAAEAKGHPDAPAALQMLKQQNAKAP